MTAAHLPRVALAGLLCLGLTGCMSYRLELLPPVADLPAPSPPEQRVTTSYSMLTLAGSDYQFTNTETQPWGKRSAGNDLAGVLTATGLFRSVEAAGENVTADLHLDCVLTVRANDIVLVAATITLFVIPTWRTTTYELTVEARRMDGTWKRYTLVDATRDIHWLPMLLVMSFRPWGEAYAEVRTNLYRTLVQRLHEDGMLRPVTASP
jgi:hypothetical protein